MADRRVTIEAVLVDLFSNPLATISKKAGEFGAFLDRLGSKFNPLTSGLSAAVTGFLSLSAANKAIASAEEAVQAEARLARALQGRADAIAAVNEQTDRIESTLGISGDKVKDVASSLVSAGVAAADLPKFLSTAVGISRDLNIPLEQVAKSLASLDAEGPEGPLGRFLPQLRQMKEEGRSNAEIIDFLAKRFGDLDATEVTIFERIRAQQEALGDESERIGLVLADVKAKFLELAVDGAQKFADVISSPEFKAFLELLLQYAPAAAKVLAAFAGFIVAKAALTALLAPLGLVLSLLGSIFTALSLIPGPLLLIGALAVSSSASLGTLPGQLESIADRAKAVGGFFAEMFGRLKGGFDELRDGKITTEDFFDLVKSEAAVLGISLKANVIDPVLLFLRTVRDDGPAVFALLAEAAIKAVAIPFKRLDDLVPSEKRSPAAQQEEAERATIENLPSRLAKVQEEAAARIRAIREGADRGLAADVSEGLARERAAADESIRIAREKFETLLSDAKDARARAARAGSLSSALLDVEEGRDVTIEKVREILNAVSEEQREGVSEALTSRLTADLEAQKISLTEFSVLREAIDETIANRRAEVSRRELDAQRERQREIETELATVTRLVEARARASEEASKFADDPVAIEGAREEVEALRRSLEFAEVEIGVRLELENDLEALSNSLEGKFGPRAFAESIRTAVTAARREIETSGGLSTPRAASLSAQVQEFEESASSRIEVQALRQVENLRARLQSVTLEAPVRLRIEDQLDELRRALSSEKFDIGVADSIEEALAKIREEFAAGDEIIPPEAFGIGEAIAELEELTRKKRDAASADEQILANTKDQAKLEERRRQLAADLVDSVNREADAQEKLTRGEAGLASATAKRKEVLRTIVEARAKEAEAAAKALPETLSGIEALQAKGGLDAGQAFQAQNAALDEVLRKIEFARGEAATLFRIDPAFGDELANISTRLDGAAESAGNLTLSFEEIEERAEQSFRSTIVSASSLQSALEQELTNIKSLEVSGLIGRDEALGRADRTFEATFAALDKLQAKLDEEIRLNPSLKDDLQDIQDLIDDARKRAQALKDDDFFDGFATGVRGVVSQFDSLARAGEEVGASLTSNLVDGVVDVWVRGEKSFNEFLGTFLEGVSVMIARVLILNALSSAIGGGGVGVFAGIFNKGGLVPELNRGGPILRLNRGGAVPAEPPSPVVRALRFAAGGIVPALRVAAGALILASAASAAAPSPSLPVAHLNSGGPVESFFGAVSRAAQAVVPLRLAGGGPGGSVPGPRVNRDIVPALLTPGEYVQPTPAVEHYGLRVMEAIRARTIPASALQELAGETTAVVRSAEPRLQGGGIVDAAMAVPGAGVGRGGRGGDGFTFPVNVYSPSELDRLLAGGLMNRIQEHMARDSANTRSALSDDE